VRVSQRFRSRDEDPPSRRSSNRVLEVDEVFEVRLEVALATRADAPPERQGPDPEPDQRTAVATDTTIDRNERSVRSERSVEGGVRVVVDSETFGGSSCFFFALSDDKKKRNALLSRQF
jgi:hypothetical protein